MTGTVILPAGFCLQLFRSHFSGGFNKLYTVNAGKCIGSIHHKIQMVLIEGAEADSPEELFHGSQLEFCAGRRCRLIQIVGKGHLSGNGTVAEILYIEGYRLIFSLGAIAHGRIPGTCGARKLADLELIPCTYQEIFLQPAVSIGSGGCKFLILCRNKVVCNGYGDTLGGKICMIAVCHHFIVDRIFFFFHCPWRRLTVVYAVQTIPDDTALCCAFLENGLISAGIKSPAAHRFLGNDCGNGLYLENSAQRSDLIVVCLRGRRKADGVFPDIAALCIIALQFRIPDHVPAILSLQAGDLKGVLGNGGAKVNGDILNLQCKRCLLDGKAGG